jgi:hypothetical protein
MPLKRAAILALLFGVSFGLVIVGALWIAQSRADRREQRDMLERMRAASAAESLFAVPREWPAFRSGEFGRAVAHLRTTCLPMHLHPDNGPYRLSYQLSLGPASVALVEPMREEDAAERSLREIAQRSPAGNDLADRYGVASPVARREELESRKAQQRAYERMRSNLGFDDTVFVATISDSAGFARTGFPILRAALVRVEGDSLVRAADSTAVYCARDAKWSAWSLRRMRRPVIQ